MWLVVLVFTGGTISMQPETAWEGTVRSLGAREILEAARDTGAMPQLFAS